MVVNENIGCYYHEMLKKVSQVPALYTTVDIFVNQLFMMFAINYSSRTIWLSSTSIILFLFRPLFGKNGLMVFQNGFLLSEIILTLISLKYFSLVWRSNLTQKFLCFFQLSQFPSDLCLLKLFLSLDPSIIAFLRDLVIKTLLLKRRTFTLTGAILFKTSRKTAWKVE